MCVCVCVLCDSFHPGFIQLGRFGIVDSTLVYPPPLRHLSSLCAVMITESENGRSSDPSTVLV